MKVLISMFTLVLSMSGFAKGYSCSGNMWSAIVLEKTIHLNTGLEYGISKEFNKGVIDNLEVIHDDQKSTTLYFLAEKVVASVKKKKCYSENQSQKFTLALSLENGVELTACCIELSEED